MSADQKIAITFWVAMTIYAALFYVGYRLDQWRHNRKK